MDNNKKEQIALAIGFILILFVSVLTIFRSNLSSQAGSSSENSKIDSRNIESKNYSTISATELQKLVITKKKNLSLLDIRSFEGYSQEHILDSLGIQLDEFPIGEKINRQNQVIIIGKNADDQNIDKAVESLRGEGFSNLLVLAGGFGSWKQFLGPTVSFGDPNSFADQSKVAYLDPEQLNEAIKSNVPLYIIDVRSNEDFLKSHIKGAINIPFDELEKRRGEITEKKVVVVGINELQEFQAAVQMYDMLLISPYVMRSAMPGWQSKGFELIKK